MSRELESTSNSVKIVSTSSFLLFSHGVWWFRWWWCCLDQETPPLLAPSHHCSLANKKKSFMKENRKCLGFLHHQNLVITPFSLLLDLVSCIQYLSGKFYYFILSTTQLLLKNMTSLDDLEWLKNAGQDRMIEFFILLFVIKDVRARTERIQGCLWREYILFLIFTSHFVSDHLCYRFAWIESNLDDVDVGKDLSSKCCI